MSEDDGELTFVETTPADDVISGRSPRLPARWTVRPWWLAALLVAVLAAGICIGYALGRHPSKPAAAPATPTPTAPPAGSVLAELPGLSTTGSVCSVQPVGSRQLVLGIEVENHAPAPIQVSDVQGSFPMGGLRVAGTAAGRCNDRGIPVLGSWVGAHGTAWLRLTVNVLVRCPQPLPVAFQIEYTVDGAPNGVSFLSFPDLGSVTYSGC